MNEFRDDSDAVGRTKQALDRDDEKQTACDQNMSAAQLFALLQEVRAEKAEAKKAEARAEKAEARAEEEKARAEEEKARADGAVTDLYNISVENFVQQPLAMAESQDCKPSITPNSEARQTVQHYRNEMRTYRKKIQEWTKANQDKNNNKRPKVGPSKQSNKAKKSKKQKEQPKKPEKPERYKFHDPAKIHGWNVGDWLKKVKLNFKDGNGKYVTHSFVNINITNGKLPHFNETCPQNYVKLCLQDIIKCSGLPVDVINEASLFSVRPDLLVVMYEGVLLFAIEIKNPDIGSEEMTRESVFQSETAAGQVYVYLHVLKQCGMDFPFALLSTHKGTVVARLADKECNDDGYANILNEVADKVDSNARSRHEQNCADQNPKTPGKQPKKKEEGESQKPMPKHSPAPKDSLSFSNGVKLPSLVGSFASNKRSDHPDDEGDQTEYSEEEEEDGEFVEKDDESEKKDGEFDYQGREVAYSEILTVKNLHRVLALVLESSVYLIKNGLWGSKRKLVPDPNSDLAGRYCILREDSFNFAKLGRCKANYNQAPMLKRNQMIFVHCTVGEGGHGRYILCSTSSGLMFVAKLFLTKKHPTNYSASDRDDFYLKEYKEKFEIATRELERWRTLYPQCKPYLKRVLKLNGLPAVPIPYFPPIPMDDRAKALPGIEECLIEVADKGFHYNDEVRWRHFGLRWASGNRMEITALDLGSLQPLKEIVLQDDLLTWICNYMDESYDPDGELVRLHEQFKKFDPLLQQKKQSPEQRANDIKGAMDWLNRMRNNGVTPKDDGSEERAEDTEKAVLKWLQRKGEDDGTNDPTGEFRKIDKMLPLRGGKTLFDLACEIEAVRCQMKRLSARRQEEPIGAPKVAIPRGATE